MQIKTLITGLTGILLLIVLNDCTEPPEEIRIILENDLNILAGRVVYLNEDVSIDTSLQDTTGLHKASASPIGLTLIAEVNPPVVAGQTLQATDVYVKSDKAYVSYNMIGEPYLGAVDVFNVQDEASPELISSLSFTDSDVNGLAFNDDHLYLAMATNRDEFDSPAVVEKIRVVNGKLSDESETFEIPSWAATDVEVGSRHLFVTSGADDGHVTVIRLQNDEVEFSYAVEDARGVSSDGLEVAVVAGTPARMLIFDYNKGELLSDYSLSGANIPFSKSTIEVYRSKAVLALGNGGTQIICLADGSVIEQIDPPNIPDLDSTLTVANAATSDGKTLYMSNGEAGVYVAWSKDSFSARACDVDDLQMIGSFRFDDLQSVNHVKVVKNYLFVAGGLGGLKILEVTELK